AVEGAGLVGQRVVDIDRVDQHVLVVVGVVGDHGRVKRSVRVGLDSVDIGRVDQGEPAGDAAGFAFGPADVEDVARRKAGGGRCGQRYTQPFGVAAGSIGQNDEDAIRAADAGAGDDVHGGGDRNR